MKIGIRPAANEDLKEVIKFYLKKVVYVTSFILMLPLFSYIVKFIMQLGRIFGTLVRIIMEL